MFVVVTQQIQFENKNFYDTFEGPYLKKSFEIIAISKNVLKTTIMPN